MPKRKRLTTNTKQYKNKSGYIGVRKNTNGSKYTSLIKIKGKQKNLGSSYATAKEAAKAFDLEAEKLGRPRTSMNFPNETTVGYVPIQKALTSRNTVGYRGVSKNGKKYRVDSKNTYVGRYDTAKEAAIAYDRAVLKANRSTSHLNFPDMVHNLDVEPERKRKYKKIVAKKKKTGSKGGAKGTSKTETGTFQALDALAALAASKKGKGSKFPTVKD